MFDSVSLSAAMSSFLTSERRQLLRVLLVIYGVIGFSSLFTLIHPRLRRPEARRIRLAVTSWWYPALFGGVMVLCGGIGGVLCNAIISLGALREFQRLLPEADRHPLLDTLALLAVPLYYGALLIVGPAAASSTLLFFGAAALPALRIELRGHDGFLAASGRLLLGLLLCVFSLGFLSRILLLRGTGAPAGAEGLVALLCIGVMVSDAFQYLSGKLFGRRALAPRLSPKKTWEGFAGGILSAALSGALLGWIWTIAATPGSPIGFVAGLALGAIAGVAGPAGDLGISMLKRQTGLKDAGDFLAGHGGVLDRIDSWLIAVPVCFYGVVLIEWLTRLH